MTEDETSTSRELAGRTEADAAMALAGLVGPGHVGVALHFWTLVMTWASDHLLPWIDLNAPELAETARMAFRILDSADDGQVLAIRAAWRKLRHVLLSQEAEFVRDSAGEAIRITSYIRRTGESGSVVGVSTIRQLGWEGWPAEIGAAAISNQEDGSKIDIVKARDWLLLGTG